MIGPFIDTIIVCTMTALAILITGAHLRGSAGGFSNEGVGITASAFSALAGWLPYLLTLAVFVFAYSTMISWSYYGERASEYLFGHPGIWPYRVVFLLFVFISPMISLDNVITFTDLLILSMVGVGIAWASIVSMPYAMLSNVLPADKMGFYMGVFNFFIVLPQIAASLGLGLIMEHMLRGHTMNAIVLGGLSMLIAAACLKFVDARASEGMEAQDGEAP